MAASRMMLAFPRLHVDPSAITGLVEWYCDRLGMSITKEMQSNKELIQWIGYKDRPQSSFVEFRSSLKQPKLPKFYNHQPSSDVYWKIGLSLVDVDTARSKLVSQGVDVSFPTQFMDIGYMCHLTDPFGYTIELLQQDFQSNFCPQKVKTFLQPNLALGQQAHIGQITLRVSNIEKSLSFYQSVLGMKLLSRQSVPHKFNLYFLACTEETPPSDDVNAVAIREWLWRRPYTTLELQHWPTEQCRKYKTANINQESGFTALAFQVDADRFQELKSHANAKDVSMEYPEYDSDVLECKDPDGSSVLFILQNCS
ncbi:uncharacterized protein [Montipora foliosa]|uniref:uncharacterized protein n=1 Tax=Montipora foliosa TaxID=591990 RepID=UPI0035F1C13A